MPDLGVRGPASSRMGLAPSISGPSVMRTCLPALACSSGQLTIHSATSLGRQGHSLDSHPFPFWQGGSGRANQRPCLRARRPGPCHPLPLFPSKQTVSKGPGGKIKASSSSSSSSFFFSLFFLQQASSVAHSPFPQPSELLSD